MGFPVLKKTQLTEKGIRSAVSLKHVVYGNELKLHNDT